VRPSQVFPDGIVAPKVVAVPCRVDEVARQIVQSMVQAVVCLLISSIEVVGVSS
jgi:hypothetical protein